MSSPVWGRLVASPRYTRWYGILRTDNVPLLTAVPFIAMLGEESASVYKLDLARLEPAQLERLVDFVLEQFKPATKTEVQAELLMKGFPIRESDVMVVVALDPRLFI